MKKMYFRNKGFPCLIIFCLIISLFSCEKNNTPIDYLKGEYYLTEEQKMLIPYTGHENIVFISNSNDTIVFKGVGLDSKIDKFYPDKSGYYDLVESKSYNYFNNTDSSYLDLNLGALQRPYYSFEISWYKKNSFNTKINLITFHLENQLEKDTSQLKQNFTYFNSYDSGNGIYNCVFKIDEKYQDINSNRNMKFLYYNIKNGIIKIEFDNSDFWTILKLK
jgi:hypothetical protein